MKASKSITAGVLVFLTLWAIGVSAESLYVTGPGDYIYSFDVVQDELDYMYTLEGLRGGGVDLAIDNDYNILFRTVESGTDIDIIEAQSLTFIKTEEFSVKIDAGIVYDSANQRLLCAERNSKKIHIFLWDPTTQSLELDETIELGIIQRACDLAINGDVLYVSEYQYSLGGSPPTSKKVYAYDMSNDFAYIETIGMGDYVITIDYNPADDSIYGGSWMGRGSESNEHIIKRTIDPNTLTTKEDIGFNIVGIAVNPDVAGRIFATTLDSSFTSAVQIWDTAGYDPNSFELVFKYDNSNTDGVKFSGLAGLVVGEDYIDPRIKLEKFDDANDCVSPWDEFTYTIQWENLSTTETATDVTLIDYLPDGVTYEAGFWGYDPNVGFIPPDPNYTEEGNYYVWELDDIGPEETGYVELTVKVNDRAEPGLWLHNKAVMTSSFGTTVTDLYTDVCCWDDGGIIYVDKRATGNNTGISWEHAYTDLQDALTRARYSSCEQTFEIWVAWGSFNPGAATDITFEIPDDVVVYGGFKGDETDPNDRDLKRYKSILTGFVSAAVKNDTVVTMGDETLLDGFIVTESAEYGIYGSGVDFAIENCTVKVNDRYGIRAIDGDVTIKWCFIRNNELHGIRHEGEVYTLTVENSWIMRNARYGIYSIGSTPTIKNSIVSESSFIEEGWEGISIVNPTQSPVLHNNTIANNKAEGIYFKDDETISDPNDKDWPDVQNCIIYYNNGGGAQLYGFNPDSTAYYCCIADCNEPPGTTNFNDEPGFAYIIDPMGEPDPNNYHLAYNSVCKDEGNPDPNYTAQLDMDGDDRVVDDYVDVGADEIYSCYEPLGEDDIYNALDFNADGIVNLIEFNKFSCAWLSHDPNDPDWLSDPNLVDPNDVAAWKKCCNLDDTGDSAYTIDIDDFVLFCDNWLWMACWYEGYNEVWGMSMAMGGGGSLLLTESFAVESDQFPEPEKTIEEQLADAEAIVAWLEEISKEKDFFDYIDKKLWKEFVDKIYDWLGELETLYYEDKTFY